MTTPSPDAFQPPSPGDLGDAAVVTLQDVVQSILVWTAALGLMAALVVVGGVWLLRRRRRIEEP